ncbi:PREDICTED: binder of sperm protein homolog 1 [Bison bison bison]|uniref:Binder of sperm protein homolog 1 n=1 Tax=Bison bison bison TaxID=43346 RepID=A0A6P3I827_BISBB|nr:PREDICTED: binder of sperm protein homolog 1 [Bos mutus]XP_010847989.1 PREDICTED: binder of sperm protein homolog 1 [Bison bison bison]
MALPVGLLSVSVYWLHSVAGLQHGGGKCFFPFRYRDGIFHDCVQFRVKHKWCSLNETYQGYWKYCSEEDFAKCVFPFWYRHLIYWGCTEDGDSFGKAWCSLTRNYNKDRVWKYCD